MRDNRLEMLRTEQTLVEKPCHRCGKPWSEHSILNDMERTIVCPPEFDPENDPANACTLPNCPDHGEHIHLMAAPDCPDHDRKESNPKDSAATTRIDITLFPSSAIVYGALGMAEGDLKYGGYNYRVVGVKASVYVAACCRHLFKYFWCGEWADPKTKVPHLGNALACLAILVDGHEQGNIVDDRPPKQSSSLFEKAEEIMKHLQTIFPRKTPRYTEIEHGGKE